MLNFNDFRAFEILSLSIKGGITKDGVKAVIETLGCFGSDPHPQCDNICDTSIQLEGGGEVFVSC